MLQEDQIVGSLVLDHLGIISSVIDKIGLMSKIDARLPVSQEKGAKLTMGERVSAMILNGLGFMDDRLYMFPEFLSNKPVDKLFRPDVRSDMFNDHALGRCLDAISDYGPTNLFSEVAFEIGTAFNLLGKTARLDTTTLTVFGEYDHPTLDSKSDNQTNEFKISHGYSKDGRPDLKQMVLNIATTGAKSFPIWMEAHKGNASDKIILQQSAKRMSAFCKQLKAAPAFLFVSDSAMYEKCVIENPAIHWLSRVPGSINQSKVYLQKSDKDITWQILENGYKISSFRQVYKGVDQRWLLVYSEQSYNKEVATLERKIDNEYDSMRKVIDKFENQLFSCKPDGEKALTFISKSIKYHELLITQVKEITKYNGQGRPKQGAQPTIIGYNLSIEMVPNRSKIDLLKAQQGRFILATNELDNKVLTDHDILLEYKDQYKTEQGFRFIKGNAFEVSSVFLKKASRIQALMMVMTLCLMVYSFSELWLHQSLVQHNATVPNQLKKPTQKPTMIWVSRLFYGIHELHLKFKGYIKKYVINLKKVTKQIISYFGPKAMAIYGLKTNV
ncbi:IS1634-like element ISCca6 family transposase [Cardinium endosymbiont of Bemisia tabaci]|uniref:IS1634-like element ISCca6 family transposase n=1 Tax=Cardinium endosymbiont of Bemisia tabaci TaxID=672794 RepID=UPI000442D1C4|nr:IS1634-like element ISCca6 family transposase [Cardinium endosymbiont of Bemisia tabaci]CDG49523.1 Transposase ISCca6, IS1634 family [Cardinium endosymbiont cBtQ1 of Bemisia tabaci]CDG50035.1 Transposase ISCca6, IS1634 family [Cardinium endosymbiont cBtQ1 of Bemisia tabaci]